MGQEGGEIWAGQALLQPISFKSDRLLGDATPETCAADAIRRRVFRLADVHIPQAGTLFTARVRPPAPPPGANSAINRIGLVG